MFDVVLFEPEIPPNTGNLMRLVANTGNVLHLIHPLGFELSDRRLRRAGLDYREWADVVEHDSLDAYAATAPNRILALTRDATDLYTELSYQPGDALLFGPESVGLPPSVLGRDYIDRWLRIPMLPQSRSLNLSNAAAIVVYEAWRQNGFSTPAV